MLYISEFSASKFFSVFQLFYNTHFNGLALRPFLREKNYAGIQSDICGKMMLAPSISTTGTNVT
jgi:hypothetical protein